MEKVASLIIAYFVFDNVGKYRGDNEDVPDLDRDNNDPVGTEIYADDVSAFLQRKRGEEKRKQLMTDLFRKD